MGALIYKSTGSFYLAKDDMGHFCRCRMRGKLKMDRSISTTNPVAVGDWVALSADSDLEGLFTILSIKGRRNYIVRSAVNRSFERQIIAANIDLGVLVVTLQEPFTSQGFMDRFLVTAAAYHIPVLIVFNKSDSYRGHTLLAWEHKKGILESVGYSTVTVSALYGDGFAALEAFIKDKTVLFCGHSGVGKSTLINRLIPGLDLQTAVVSDYTEKGKHTTTFAQMYDLPFGGKIIDTPGIKELGLVDIGRVDLAHYFPEMAVRMAGCKFHNCVHDREPGCAVKAGVASGGVSQERYESYLRLLGSL